MRQLGRPETEPLVRCDNHHLKVLHLGVSLDKAGGFGPEPVLEPRLGLHLHLKQHHRLLRCAAFAAARAEGTIEAVTPGP